MGYLFDTDAISEVLKARPSRRYVEWLAKVPRADADLRIAATALQHGLRLVTGNVRHFERVPDLEIERVLAHERPRP